MGGQATQKICVRVSRALGSELARFLGSADLEHNVSSSLALLERFDVHGVTFQNY